MGWNGNERNRMQFNEVELNRTYVLILEPQVGKDFKMFVTQMLLVDRNTLKLRQWLGPAIL